MNRLSAPYNELEKIEYAKYDNNFDSYIDNNNNNYNYNNYNNYTEHTIYDKENVNYEYVNTPYIHEQVILPSFHRCGNTLVRELIEGVTNTITGSDDNHNNFINNPNGEDNMPDVYLNFKGSNIIDDSVWSYKTHYPLRKSHFIFKFSKIILITRNIFDVLDSLFNLYVTNSHTNSIDKNCYKEYESTWKEFTSLQSSCYKNFHKYWIMLSLYYNIPCLIIKYEDLITNTKEELTNIICFMIGYNSIKNTIIEKNLELYLNNRHLLYIPRKGTNMHSIINYSDDQLIELLKDNIEYVNYFGYFEMLESIINKCNLTNYYLNYKNNLSLFQFKEYLFNNTSFNTNNNPNINTNSFSNFNFEDSLILNFIALNNSYNKNNNNNYQFCEISNEKELNLYHKKFVLFENELINYIFKDIDNKNNNYFILKWNSYNFNNFTLDCTYELDYIEIPRIKDNRLVCINSNLKSEILFNNKELRNFCKYLSNIVSKNITLEKKTDMKKLRNEQNKDKFNVFIKNNINSENYINNEDNKIHNKNKNKLKNDYAVKSYTSKLKDEINNLFDKLK